MTATVQRSFTGGEIAPALRSRADMTKYATGLALCENFFVRSQGGVYSRPGLRFVGPLVMQEKVGRLIPFQFNTDQSYVLVFEHHRMHVVKNGAFVTTGGGFGDGFGDGFGISIVTYGLQTPYSEDQLSRLGFTQSGDVLTIVHPDHDPADLTRLADDDWTLADIPYAITIEPPIISTRRDITNITQANPGVVTVSLPHFLENGNTVIIRNVVGMTEVNDRAFIVAGVTATTYNLGESTNVYGAYVSDGDSLGSGIVAVGEGEGTYTKGYVYVVTSIDEGGRESLQSLPGAIVTESLSTTAGAKIEWSDVAGAVSYRVYKDPSVLTGVYGWIGNTKVNVFTDFNVAPLLSDSPPEDSQPFEGAGNRPSAVNYYQQRQVFANSYSNPQTMWTTQIGDYQSMRSSQPARDDDAIEATLAGRQINEIRHIVSIDALILLTSGGEWLAGEGQDKVLTPATVRGRLQSYNGASWVPPVVINSTTVFVQEKGARLRDLSYEFAADTYTGNDLSIMAEHLFDEHEILEMAYADEPYGILWCVREDGVLLGLTYHREHKVWAWHQHTTAGFFESVASVSEGGRDTIYAIVRRTIEGNTVRYVERLDPRVTASPYAFFVDSGLTYDGPPATVLSGLDHLEGEAVAVLADGYVVNDLTVSGGSITLEREASVVQVGLPYTPAVELLDIDIPQPNETIKSESISVSKVTLEVEQSRGGWVGPVPDATQANQEMREIKPRYDADFYDPIEPRTFKPEIFIEPHWSKGGGLRIEQRDPLPFAILSVIPRVDVGG